MKSVLVIDDDSSAREHFRRHLRTADIKVSVAFNAKYGMEALEKEPFDCVFCDLKMPLVSGEKVLDHIKTQYPSTPVVMLTEYGKWAEVVDLIRRGAYDYMVKPIPKETMLQTVRRAAEYKARVEEEKRRQEEQEEREREKLRDEEKRQKRAVEMNRQTIVMCEFVNKLNTAKNMKGILALVEIYTAAVIKCRQVVTMLLKDEDFAFDEFKRLTSVPKRCFTLPAGSEEPLLGYLTDKLASIYNPSSPDVEILQEIPYDIGTDGLVRSAFIPLSANSCPLGIIILYEARGHDRDYSEQDKLQMLYIAEVASTAIHNCLKSLKLEKGYLDTVRALTEAVEAKDSYTRGHSDRVRGYAVRMARRLGLDDEQIKYIDIAGILHDMGKIGIPLNIINKRMRLSPLEYEKIKSHPVMGEKMISHIKFLEPVRDIIRHHHERFDGKGYPDGLSGDEIRMEARILAVADSYDAMTSDRPYRKARSPYDAYLELERNAGSQFDPRCVAALGEILRENLLYLSAV